MGLLLAIWRRIFGGADLKWDFLEQRGVQMILLIIAVGLWECLIKGYSWYMSLVIGGLVYLFWCGGHWYYFQCGTESDKYIDDELASGRKPCLDWLVRPINKRLGFPERSKRYCFIGMLCRYGLYSIPASLFVGSSFFIVGCLVPFIYNACYWINLPKVKYMQSPTNWAEFITGLFIGWALW